MPLTVHISGLNLDFEKHESGWACESCQRQADGSFASLVGVGSSITAGSGGDGGDAEDEKDSKPHKSLINPT